MRGKRLQMRDHRSLLLMVVLIAGLAGAACGTSGETEPDSGQNVPFRVCHSLDSWTRPSQEEQALEVWTNPRYARRDAEQLREFFYQDFFAWHGGGRRRSTWDSYMGSGQLKTHHHHRPTRSVMLGLASREENPSLCTCSCTRPTMSPLAATPIA